MMQSSLDILKVGGSCLDRDLDAVADHIAAKMTDSAKLIVVHGFGPKLRAMLAQENIDRPTFISASGVPSHYTDETVMALSYAAAAVVQRKLLHKLASHALPAIGSFQMPALLSGQRKTIRYRDGDTLRKVTGDFSGKIKAIKHTVLNTAFADSRILLIAPIIEDEDGSQLVCDSDSLAAFLAQACRINEMVFLTDVDGFLKDGQTVQSLTATQLPDMITIAGGGMKKKLIYIQKIATAGVEKVIIRNALKKQNPEEETVIHLG